MRPVFHGDVVAAARAIYALAPRERAGALDRLIRAATWAETFRRCYHRAHPYWGDGSLMAVALTKDLPPEPALADPEYCTCLSQVLETVARFGRLHAGMTATNGILPDHII